MNNITSDNNNITSDNNNDNKLEYDNLKIRVITRAFYEDAYLDFFIRYYASLGFDTITILKADADIFNYKILDDIPSIYPNTKIEIIPVVNEGNQILKTHYKYYADKEYDWILNIDTDEFLIFDLALYPSGIKEFIYKLTTRIKNEYKLPSTDTVQQIKFRWMCINKLNNKWTDKLTEITNTEIKLPTDLEITDIEPKSLAGGYFLSYPLELYKFVKSIGNTKWSNPNPEINCHFFCPVLNNGRMYNLMDGDFRGINNSDPKHYPRNGTMLKDGFILHINTRSLANAVTKCLTTKLRDNKKISDLPTFQNLINNFKINDNTTSEELQKIKQEFTSLLNSKSYFPIKIRKFNQYVKKYIQTEKWSIPLTNMLSEQHLGINKLITQYPFVNEDIEWQQLTDLCRVNNINPENMRHIISLF